MGVLSTNQKPIAILLIEDDLEDVNLITKALAHTGGDTHMYHLKWVSSFDVGMEVLSAGHFDLLLLDITLPGCHGLEALASVQGSYPEIPVVVLTNTDDDNLALAAVGHGAQDYLVKHSFDGNMLKRAVAHAIERHNLLSRLDRSSEARFRNIVEKITDGMVVVDLEGTVRFLNPAVESIFERRASDVIDKRFDFLILAWHESQSDEAMDDLSLRYIKLLSKTGKTTELEISLEGDLKKLVEMRSTEIEWEKKLAYMVVFHDITSLVRLQRLKTEIFERERIAKLKDEFISTVSHELRTPLAIVKCAIENMRDGVAGELTAKQEKVVKIASSNVDRLTKLIDDILDLSRLEANMVRLATRPIAIDQLVHETLKRFTLFAKEQGIVLNADIPLSLPVIHADIDKITQVLDNLVSNALRFAKNQVTMSARMISHELASQKMLGGEMVHFESFASKGMDGVQVSVTDDGPGILQEKVDYLFNKFVQIGRPAGGAGYKGTGLGLAICKEIIELHQGKIWAESKYGNGASFHFVLPQGHEAAVTDKKLIGSQEENTTGVGVS